MEITQQCLEELKTNSIDTARNMNLFNSNVLSILKDEVSVKVDYNKRPAGNWYGQAICDANVITVFDKNLSTLDISKLDDSELTKILEKDNFSPETIPQVIQGWRNVSKELLFELFNQSGMDHEILGHLGNHLAKKEWDESSARQTQYEVAEFRSIKNPSWNTMVHILPIVNQKITDSL